MNKLNGVVGVFNCQGAGSWPTKQEADSEDVSSSALPPISGSVCPLDVEFLKEVAGENWEGDSAVYAYNSSKHQRLTFSHTDIYLSYLQ